MKFISWRFEGRNEMIKKTKTKTDKIQDILSMEKSEIKAFKFNDIATCQTTTWSSSYQHSIITFYCHQQQLHTYFMNQYISLCSKQSVATTTGHTINRQTKLVLFTRNYVCRWVFLVFIQKYCCCHPSPFPEPSQLQNIVAVINF